MYNLEREELAAKINHHWSSIRAWETEDVIPNPESIKDISLAFNLPLYYFHEYYSIYYDNYTDKIRLWKENNNYTYSEIMSILEISHSGFGRLLSGKIKLSYNIYCKLKNLEVF